jgi:hypothetical protein
MAERKLTDLAAWQKGAELAFKMLREIEAASLDDTGYEPQFRDGRPQSNICAKYLREAHAFSDARCEEAFASIMTDYIASSMHAGEPSLDGTSRYIKRAIATDKGMQS